MGVVDDLAQARMDYERGDWIAALDIWSDIESDDMSAGDLHHAALAAYLLGRRDTSIDFHQRAYSLYLQAGTPAGAMHCCFHLAMIFGSGGEHALESGWTTRAERLLDGLDDNAVERGYVAMLHMYRHLESDNRCGIYTIRPHACSEFPAGSECCLFAREDILKIHDGVPPQDEVN